MNPSSSKAASGRSVLLPGDKLEAGQKAGSGTFRRDGEAHAAVLGALVVEHEAGRAALCSLLADVDRTAAAVDALRRAHGVDGLLLNVEVPVHDIDLGGAHVVARLIELMTRLRRRGCAVVWYDAVTSEGELAWQNAVNAKNEVFFHAADLFFTNYTYTADQVRSSAEAVRRAGCDARRVLMGVDVWGRNSFGGGGLQIGEALRLHRWASTSSALFAPAWVHEVDFGVDDWRVVDRMLWRIVERDGGFLPRPVTAYPLHTSFDDGRCAPMHAEGARTGERRFDLARWSLQPLDPFETCDGDAYDGAVAVRVPGGKHARPPLPLLRVALPAPAHGRGLRVDVAWKEKNRSVLRSDGARLSLHLVLASTHRLVLPMRAGHETMPEGDGLLLVPSRVAPKANGWQLSTWLLGCHEPAVRLLAASGGIGGLLLACNSEHEMLVGLVSIQELS